MKIKVGIIEWCSDNHPIMERYVFMMKNQHNELYLGNESITQNEASDLDAFDLKRVKSYTDKVQIVEIIEE